MAFNELDYIKHELKFVNQKLTENNHINIFVEQIDFNDGEDWEGFCPIKHKWCAGNGNSKYYGATAREALLSFMWSNKEKIV